MNYSGGEKVLLGDIADLGSGTTGTVVAVIGDGVYADGFPEKEWDCLGAGASLTSSDFGLVHYVNTEYDFTLVRRAEQSGLDDSMESCLLHLEDAARTIASGPQLAVQQFHDHFAAAWEHRQELLTGASLLSWSRLPERLRQCGTAAFLTGAGDCCFSKSWS